jgi:hypothetical protein
VAYYRSSKRNTLEVDLMHVLHRPHVPRLIGVSITAAILALVISLMLASGLNNISQPGGNSNGPVGRAAPAPTGALQTTMPRWLSNPFAPLLGRPLPQPWATSHT